MYKQAAATHPAARHKTCRFATLLPCSTCEAELAKSMCPDCTRPREAPYVWPGSAGAPINYWPLFASLDHGWYLNVSGTYTLPASLLVPCHANLAAHPPDVIVRLQHLPANAPPMLPSMLQVDVGNEDCMAKRAAGWWGWGVALTTANGLGAGTDGQVRASWSCGSQPATNGPLPLECQSFMGRLSSHLLTGGASKLGDACFEE